MNKKKILVAGNAGMMGSHCVDYLIDNYGKKYDVYGLDNLSGSYPENINKKCIFNKIDARDEKSVTEFFDTCFKEGELEYLIHFIACAQEIGSFFSPNRINSNNYQSFRVILTNALAHKIKHVVFFSSMSRYGKGNIYNGDGELVLRQHVPFKEEYIPSPEDPYAVDKVASEMLIKAMQNVHDFTYTIWVPHNAYSPRQYVDVYRNFIAIWMNLILLNKPCYIYGSGNQTRAISWVNDFNPVICNSLFNVNTYNQTINIGGDEYKTITEWYELVKEVTGCKKDAIYIDPRPGEVFNAYCDHTKARRLTNFENKVSAENALKEMWSYFKKKGPRPFKYADNFEIDNSKIPITWKQHLF